MAHDTRAMAGKKLAPVISSKKNEHIMYSIPPDFDLNQLLGATVEQICFGKNIISINFDRSRFISFEWEFSINESARHSVYPVIQDFGLLQLLEFSISKIIANQHDNSLVIVFENDVKLAVFASDMYESYVVKTEDKMIRV